MFRLDVLWHCAALSSAEHATLRDTADGWLLSGEVVLPIDGVPGHISWRVDVDRDWVPTATRADIVVADRQVTIELLHVGGRWSVDGSDRADLRGCTDVDLGWTPATNTIPLRRLATLGVDEHHELRAAWVKFPELEIEVNEQRYTRLAHDRWRYESGPYDFELATDDHAIVTRYGDDLWRSTALLVASPPSPRASQRGRR
jgi:hypothetical protein